MQENPNLEKTYNIDIEHAVLGAIMIDNKHLEVVEDVLDAECFYSSVHRAIFLAIKTIITKDLNANSHTIAEISEVQQVASKITEDITEYLRKMEEDFTAFSDFVKFVEHLVELKTRRDAALFAKTLLSSVTEDYTKNIENILQEQERDFYDLITSKQSKGDSVLIGEEMLAVIKEIKDNYPKAPPNRGIPSGLETLDTLTNGFQPSDLIVIACRPSMGKTALALNIALSAAKDFSAKAKEGETPDGVLFLSLEMSVSQITKRAVYYLSGIPAKDIIRGTINHDEFVTIKGLEEKFSKLPVYINDTVSATISGVRSAIRKHCATKNVKMVIVDYLQLIHGGLRGRKFESRVNEIAEISKGLKEIAKEMNVPVIALSQLSRAVESREDRRPQLSDIRESGSIEQDADVVMFLYRESYYLQRKQPPENSNAYIEWQNRLREVKNQAEIIVAKQRNGAIGTVKLHFDYATNKFSDPA